MRDGSGQLRGQGNQEGFLLFRKAAVLALPDDQHPEHGTVLDNRHTEEGMIGVFARLTRKTITRMAGCIFNIDRLFTLTDHAHQSFTQTETHPTYRILSQAFRGTQDILPVLNILQINGGDIHLHRFTHALHDDVQRLLKVRCRIYFLYNSSQRIQHEIKTSV